MTSSDNGGTTAKRTAVVGPTVQAAVAFCGPIGVGKTTAVGVGSATPVASTEVAWAAKSELDSRAANKSTTTVGIDYGEWHGPDGSSVAIYGTPGQDRFSTVRKGAVSERAALVLWLYGQTSYALDEAEEWLHFLGREDPWDRLVVAVTRLDEGDDHPALDEYRPLLDSFAEGIPLLAADPRVSADVDAVIMTAVERLGSR